MDDFFKRISKNVNAIKNYEVEVTPASAAAVAAPAPSAPAEIKDPIEKFLVTDEVLILKDDTIIPIPNAVTKLIDERAFDTSMAKPEEPVQEEETAKNELEKMLEQAAETTDFLS